MILLQLPSCHIEANSGPDEHNCSVREDEVDKSDKSNKCDKCQFWCHTQRVGFSEDYCNNLISQGGKLLFLHQPGYYFEL